MVFFQGLEKSTEKKLTDWTLTVIRSLLMSEVVVFVTKVCPYTKKFYDHLYLTSIVLFIL